GPVAPVRHAEPAPVDGQAVGGEPGDGGANENVLEHGFQLPTLAGGDDNAPPRGVRPNERDQELAPEDHDDDPERQLRYRDEAAVLARPVGQEVERDEGNYEQQLVGDRIHEFAEVGNPAVLAGEVSVPEVREGRHQEE